MAEIHTPKLRAIRVVNDGSRVVVIEDDKVVLNVTWEMADAVATAMKKYARKAEEQDKALSIVNDQAFLFRSGIPIGLSNRKDIQKEAVKEALYNKRLRRIMPNKMGNIESKESFGTPSLIQKEPK